MGSSTHLLFGLFVGEAVGVTTVAGDNDGDDVKVVPAVLSEVLLVLLVILVILVLEEDCSFFYVRSSDVVDLSHFLSFLDVLFLHSFLSSFEKASISFWSSFNVSL